MFLQYFRTMYTIDTLHNNLYDRYLLTFTIQIKTMELIKSPPCAARGHVTGKMYQLRPVYARMFGNIIVYHQSHILYYMI